MLTYIDTYTLMQKVWFTGAKKQKQKTPALAVVAEGIECQPANQRVGGWTPSQDTCLGCRARSPAEGMREATTH